MNSTGDRGTCEEAVPAAVQPLPPGVTPGAAVSVRGSRWWLDALVAHADCYELHLRPAHSPHRSGPGHRSLGEGGRVLLWPFDRPIAADLRPRARTVGLWRWAAAIGSAIADGLDPLTPRTRTCSARILSYQLAPAVAIAGGVSRVLLADEVGLGKTIQAGWIAADLLTREHAARILVAVPAGLRRQWCDELSTWFDIRPTAVDSRWLRRRIADLPGGVSPWAAPGVYLGSVDFLKRLDVARSLGAHVWDLLIVDEAHTAASPTDRYAALAAVAARARRVVAITATPYSGDTASFASMAALGAAGGDPPPLMFRRSREDVGDPRRRRHRFATVRITKIEVRLQRLLGHYTRKVWRNAPGDVEGARLAVTILRKRALSSPAAAARSLRRRLDLLVTQGPAAIPRQLTLFDEDDEAGDEVPEGALGAPGLADGALEQRWLTALIEAADDAAGVDSKQRCLGRLLRRVGREPVIVFTEYRDTLLQLAATLPSSLQLHGGLNAAARAEVQARFNEAGGLLLATDAAAEGLNLQRRCRIVVNYELPWNPARLEQRIGRVDRIGQARAVHAITLVARDTAEDLVIANLARRLARVVATLGERDRLGAFLTDARTARMVIAGAEDDANTPPALPELPEAITRAPAVGEEARAAAERLAAAPASAKASAGKRAASQSGRNTTPDHRSTTPRLRQAASAKASAPKGYGGQADLLVSTLRASSQLTSGFVVAVRCALRTGEGDVVASRVAILHVSRSIVKPRSRAAARAMAAKAASSVPEISSVIPDLAAWLATATRIHERSIDGRLARESSLQSRPAAQAWVQPGLFDRRALRAAEDLFESDREIQAEHQWRMAALERARPLRLSCTPIGVLIVWR
jgi:superfamily II DNA/RNA helicase